MRHRSAPLMTDPDDPLWWLDHIACADLDVADFTPPAGHGISPAAAAACRTCPVQKPCLQAAYESGHLSVVRAGFTPGQLQAMALPDALAALDQQA